MARKKKIKTTQYTKNRNRILAYIRRQRKKNLVTDLYIPTERELRKQGVKGTELAKLTRELKALNPKTLESHFYNPFEIPRYWDKDEALKNKDKLFIKMYLMNLYQECQHRWKTLKEDQTLNMHLKGKNRHCIHLQFLSQKLTVKVQ